MARRLLAKLMMQHRRDFRAAVGNSENQPHQKHPAEGADGARSGKRRRSECSWRRRHWSDVNPQTRHDIAVSVANGRQCC